MDPAKWWLIILATLSPLSGKVLSLSNSQAPQSSEAKRGSVDPLFRSVAASLREKTEIPARLPSRMPDIGQGSGPIYATLKEASPEESIVVIGFVPDCNGASFCRLGTLSAPSGVQSTVSSVRPTRCSGQWQEGFL